MLTNLYIDGLNLYHRAVKGTPYKWLDLRRLAETLFPHDAIQSIHYFTSRLITRPGKSRVREEGRQLRQNAYLRALESTPGLFVHYGAYLVVGEKPPIEKKTDVNLASRLIADGFKGAYEQAAVISKDTDFVGALRCVRDEVGLPVVIVNPDCIENEETPDELRESATRVVRVRKRHLAACQFPPVVYDGNGAISKPPEWE